MVVNAVNLKPSDLNIINEENIGTICKMLCMKFSST